MSAVLKMEEFGDGDGGSGCIGCYIADQQITEMRDLMRRLLDSEGEEATKVMEEATCYLDGLDTIDREDEAEEAMLAHQGATHCDCGTFKGVGTSYCPECDKEALERQVADWRANKIVPINLPF